MNDPGPIPLSGATLEDAGDDDVAELLVLQRCCWVTEAIENDTLAIPALHEDNATVRAWVERMHVWLVRRGPRLVAAVRAIEDGQRWEIGRLMVAPDLRGAGLGRWLLAYAESRAPEPVRTFALFTGRHSRRNLAMYRAAGYRITEPPATTPVRHIDVAVHLTKPRVTASVPSE